MVVALHVRSRTRAGATATGRRKPTAKPLRSNRRGRWYKSGWFFNAQKSERQDSQLQLQKTK
jgi:hypothetical protein